MKKPVNTQALVRNTLKAHKGELRMAEIRDLIGLSGDKGYARVNHAITDLVKSGEVKRAGYGKYIYAGKIPDAKFCKAQNSLWRLMWIRTKKNKPFTARKLHEISGVSLYTVTDYITFLLKSGYLEKVGKKRVFKIDAPLYLLVADKMNGEVPTKRRKAKTAEIEKQMDKVRELAAIYLKISDTKLETIHELSEATNKISEILEICKEILLSRKKVKRTIKTNK